MRIYFAFMKRKVVYPTTIGVSFALGSLLGANIGQELASRHFQEALLACNETNKAVTRIAEKQIDDKEQYIKNLCTPCKQKGR